MDALYIHREAETAREPRTIERQRRAAQTEVSYPRHVRVESTGIRNVPLIEVACDEIARRPAEVAVDVPFPATDVDHAPDLGSASDTIQCSQHPTLAGAVRRQEKLVVQPTARLYYGKLHVST